MHPLAHMLTGALIGQVAPTRPIAIAGGWLSHYVLDALPHTEGKTFWPHRGSTFGVDTIEAGAEFIAGSMIVGWLLGHCHGAHSVSVALGVLSALVPDLIDVPLKLVSRVTLLHAPGLHWTVRRSHALSGILTQVAVIGAAAMYLWRASGCG